MLLLSVVLVILVFLAVMLVAGNNLSACVGPAIGSRIVTKRFGVLVGAAGFSAGLLVQGSSNGHIPWARCCLMLHLA